MPLRGLTASSFVVLAAVVTGCSGSSGTDLRDPIARGTTPPGSNGGDTTPGSTSDTDGTTSADGTTPSAEDPSAPIHLKNVSFAAAQSRYGYGDALDITFAVVNTAGVDIDRVQEVSLTFAGEKRTFPTSCDGLLVSGMDGSPKVLTLHLVDTSTGSTLAPSCGSSATGASTKPWGDTVTVELKGLLDDATPWKARGTGSR